MASGALDLPTLAPGAEGIVDLPEVADATTERWMTLEVAWREAPAWGAAGHVVSRAQAQLAAAPPRPVRATTSGWRGNALGDAVFDRRGGLVRWRDLEVSGPLPELWRAPTENDQLDGQGSYETADPALTDGRGDESTPASSVRWFERGLDRLQHRVLSVERTEQGLVQRVRSMAAHSAQGIETTFAWRLDGDGLRLHTDIRPFGPWDCTWPRVGARIGLPGALAEEHARWFGTGPAESYSDSAEAAYVGRFEAAVDELGVAYGRPQETGHRPGLRALDLGPLHLRAVASGSTGLPGFQLDRHTAQERTGVAHAHELEPAMRLRPRGEYVGR